MNQKSQMNTPFHVLDSFKLGVREFEAIQTKQTADAAFRVSANAGVFCIDHDEMCMVAAIDLNQLQGVSCSGEDIVVFINGQMQKLELIATDAFTRVTLAKSLIVAWRAFRSEPKS